MKKTRELTSKEAEEFWESLIKEGKPVTFYAKKYKTSIISINQAYNKMKEKHRRK